MPLGPIRGGLAAVLKPVKLEEMFKVWKQQSTPASFIRAPHPFTRNVARSLLGQQVLLGQHCSLRFTSRESPSLSS